MIFSIQKEFIYFVNARAVGFVYVEQQKLNENNSFSKTIMYK